MQDSGQSIPALLFIKGAHGLEKKGKRIIRFLPRDHVFWKGKVSERRT